MFISNVGKHAFIMFMLHCFIATTFEFCFVYMLCDVVVVKTCKSKAAPVFSCNNLNNLILCLKSTFAINNKLLFIFVKIR